jgi:hypothetical protein
MTTKFLAAAALFIASISNFASAADYNVDLTLGADGSYTADFGATHSAANKTPVSFTDTFTFSPDVSLSLVDALLHNSGFSKVLNIDFTSVTLNGYALNIQNGVFDYAFTEQQLSLQGALVLSVSGLTGGNASYAGTINVLPVPEPETYALMLGGLGLVGFVARRRKSAKQAA